MKFILLGSLFILFVSLIVFFTKKMLYENTEYCAQTKNSFLKVHFNKGLLGEFYTYKYLKPLKGYKKFLFNLYIPAEEEETTEIDVVLLHESGIYVFESKNYSGWIFGTETQKYWTQTLPTGKGRSQKTKFYNPIFQNKGHIKWLQQFLGDQPLPLYSYIVFSDRCTLKNITLTSGQHSVVNRYHLLREVKKNSAKKGTPLSKEKIDELFQKLYPLSQADEVKKITHIENIEKKKSENNTNQNRNCPRCGGKLLMRTALKGKRQGKTFLGCSNYPKCRYIQNLESE